MGISVHQGRWIIRAGAASRQPRARALWRASLSGEPPRVPCAVAIGHGRGGPGHAIGISRRLSLGMRGGHCRRYLGQAVPQSGKTPEMGPRIAGNQTADNNRLSPGIVEMPCWISEALRCVGRSTGADTQGCLVSAAFWRAVACQGASQKHSGLGAARGALPCQRNSLSGSAEEKKALADGNPSDKTTSRPPPGTGTVAAVLARGKRRDVDVRCIPAPLALVLSPCAWRRMHMAHALRGPAGASSRSMPRLY
ncbi:hypothetical protein GGX14DRAFT_643109 [Mycena pura]|uniref:Uncharacterized protein n=1 Tax=Mycena pura TaxID=153505 RepID=A0AAD6YQG7_9AGAR|nr:hypothetical protein GGX14DRAFT_643109 [Mycena pura]